MISRSLQYVTGLNSKYYTAKCGVSAWWIAPAISKSDVDLLELIKFRGDLLICFYCCFFSLHTYHNVVIEPSGLSVTFLWKSAPCLTGSGFFFLENIIHELIQKLVSCQPTLVVFHVGYIRQCGCGTGSL